MGLNMRSRFVFLVVVLFLTGCAAGPMVTTKGVATDVRTEVFEAPYGDVFQAVRSAYTVKGFGIDEADRGAGLLRSQYKQSSNIVGAKSRSRFSASLTEVDSTQTRVRLTMTAQQQTVGGWSAATLSQSNARKFYTDAFGTIREQLDN